ncbi:SGNH/GDSL hydrolase family protein [Verrucomicrobia bacterium]|nr:SGNH/GDSL hydrolase family protein [Verrucomicrobiota bacterium]MDA7662153.1 SGNH/GDSL hydrolase family protein [Verrucomicrobiota bacterium]MDC0263819.1 SGNH/GDSL hydrolase family protein [Verrucomicrobiota bacterium]
MQHLNAFVALCAWVLCTVSLAAQETNAAEALSLRDGDRVVFLGNTFFERALDHGHLETSLTVRWPEKRIIFRNLGWDGDTVYGHSRAGGRRRQVFGDVEEGFRRMMEHLESEKPSVVFVAYGFNESFDGIQGLASFQKGLNRLLDRLENLSRQIVLITPPAVVVHDNPFNLILGRYAEILLETARSREHLAVDLFGVEALNDPACRENGLHLSAAGYRKAAEIWVRELKLPPVRIDLNNSRADKVRQAIIKKNTLYFHRWRPRNDAFVFGERRDEQKIAQKEPLQFEPYIEQQEQRIRKLLKP